MRDNKIKVLFIDDDLLLGQIVVAALKEKAFEVVYQNSLVGVEACLAEFRPDMIVLDVEIGAVSGIEIMPKLNAKAPKTPVLFLSSHTGSHTVIKALNAGAVNYLRKPFEVDELIAYIERFAVPQTYIIPIGTLSLNTDTRELIDGNSNIIKQLSDSEFKLLKLFATHLNQTISRAQIEKEIWSGGLGSEHSLNNFISKLRKYLAADHFLELITIRKEGYKLSLPA